MRLACLGVVSVLLLVGCTTPARLAVDERAWIQLETENFTIWTCVSEARARRLGQRMELFRSVAEFVIGQRLPKARLPIRMIAFPDLPTYSTFAGRGSAGLYMPSMSENFMLASLKWSRAGGTTTSVIQHEYVHFLLDQHAKFIYPAWYHEGFAELLGATRFRGNDVEIGGITKHGVPFVTFRHRDVWTHVRDLLSYGVGGHSGDDVGQRYPESWALVHYLYFGRKGMGTGPRQVALYLQLIAEGSSVSDAVEAAYGVNVDTLDEELRAYVTKGHYPGATIDRSKFPSAPEPKVTPLPRIDVARQLGELARLFGNDREARNYFERALAIEPDDAGALMGHALLLADDENNEEAEAMARAALAAAPEDARMHRIAGDILRQRAADEKEDPAERAALARRARKHYVRSWKLDDSVPATYASYGSTFLLDGQEAARGLKTLEHAHAMLPTSIPILNWLARVHMQVGSRDEARRLALMAYSSPIYGSGSMREDDVEKLEELLDETGGVPRDADDQEDD
ncbi:MAG: hypothetical protein JRH16_00540 [Deltaproteobacteria bacterium]|nr:hypothetical protein [Deltaproteobacteria bacterium]MBW2359450.1 hypothetical protein [Deltaproteobacteria bacterium]